MTNKQAPYDSESLLRATADKLLEVLDSIELAKPSKDGKDTGQHDSTVRNLTRVSTAIAAVGAELRQHAKAAVREVSDIPLDRIMAHLKSLPEHEREQLARELTGADQEEGLL